MKVPPRLSELLSRDDLLNAETLRALGLAMPWFEDNKVVFFPEYTDHGPKHVQEVLDSVESLITYEAWDVLNPEDAAVLILGVLLHDCAMHLSKDGFVTLLTEPPGDLNKAFGDRPWRQLWEEFLAEARRFDERKLKALFDKPEPVEPPNLDPLEMKEKDCLLIGEFLRRHHARLAHEIALTGVPGPPGRRLVIGTLPGTLNDLAGIVARSHGLNLRACVDYFNARSKSGARRTNKTHVTYLMALLRIADYIQIHRERAPEQVLEVRALHSPISRGEWRAHHAITDMHQEDDDPEAIWVEAAPQDVNTYLKLKRLLKDIQRELDESWAVLGEVYASNAKLRGLWLAIRRIKSTLDDEAAFAHTVNYVPRRATLESAGAELLKLLIAPLYGNNPSIGVRELLQNAVDACRELKDYRERNPGLPAPDLLELQADVAIHVAPEDDGVWWLYVYDRGVGMTADTVINYFLKAGASFRSSDAWWRQHADSQGRTRVLRSGRFGIGVLAGFLLGPEIQVFTRHIASSPGEGVSFICRLDDDVVQLNRVELPVGTMLRVRLSEDAVEYFTDEYAAAWDTKWDWYCLAEPSVRRIVLAANNPQPPAATRTRAARRSRKDVARGPEEAEAASPRRLKSRVLEQQWSLPSPGGPLPPGWRRFKPAGFQECHWTYGHAPELVCNGIYIGSLRRDDYRRSPPLGGWVDRFDGEPVLDRWVLQPNVSVFDPYGKLPLNLQRTQLNGPLPFNDELLASVHRDLIAYLLVNTPATPPPASRRKAGRRPVRYRPLHYRGARVATWYWYAPQGVSLFSPWHVGELAPRRLFVIPPGDNRAMKFIGSVSSNPVVPFFGGGKTAEDDAAALLEEIEGPEILGRRVLARILKARSWSDGSFDHYPSEWNENAWVLLRDGDCPPLDFDPAELARTLEVKNVPCLGVYYPLPHSGTDELAPMEQTWLDVVGLPYIPYDPLERKARLSRAYEELAEYIESWTKEGNEREDQL